jgi:DNA-binding transcriptional regulator YbjK
VGLRRRWTRRSSGLRGAEHPNGEFARQDGALAATTVFDFAWRMRTRSNYGDPAMYYVGTLDAERSRTYAEAVRAWNSATMFVFEALIAQRARQLLEDVAVHFISRDRSKLADELIVPRLRALGLLESTPSA